MPKANLIGYLRFKQIAIKLKYIDADGYYGYQCVDLIRRYCWDVYNYNMGKLPTAIQATLKGTFPGGKWKEFKPGEEMKRGDILIFGGTKMGHIAICHKPQPDGVRVLEQNGKGGAGTKTADGKYPKLPGNEVRLRFIKRGTLVKFFRYYW